MGRQTHPARRRAREAGQRAPARRMPATRASGDGALAANLGAQVTAAAECAVFDLPPGGPPAYLGVELWGEDVWQQVEEHLGVNTHPDARLREEVGQAVFPYVSETRRREPHVQWSVALAKLRTIQRTAEKLKKLVESLPWNETSREELAERNAVRGLLASSAREGAEFLANVESELPTIVADACRRAQQQMEVAQPGPKRDACFPHLVARLADVYVKHRGEPPRVGWDAQNYRHYGHFYWLFATIAPYVPALQHGPRKHDRGELALGKQLERVLHDNATLADDGVTRRGGGYVIRAPMGPFPEGHDGKYEVWETRPMHPEMVGHLERAAEQQKPPTAAVADKFARHPKAK